MVLVDSHPARGHPDEHTHSASIPDDAGDGHFDIYSACNRHALTDCFDHPFAHGDIDVDPDTYGNSDPHADADFDPFAHSDTDNGLGRDQYACHTFEHTGHTLQHTDHAFGYPAADEYPNVDVYTHADADGHTHADADGHAHADADGHTHADADGHAHADADGHTHTDADGHTHTDADGYADADRHAHADADGYAHTDADGYAHADADGYAHTDEYTSPGRRPLPVHRDKPRYPLLGRHRFHQCRHHHGDLRWCQLAQQRGRRRSPGYRLRNVLHSVA
jgi:hypothetical protein